MFAEQGRKGNKFSGLAITGYSMSVALIAIAITTMHVTATHFDFSPEITGSFMTDTELVYSEDEVPGNGPWCIPLVLEDETEVGAVKVVRAGDMITALYTITEEGWCLNDTQLHVGLNNMPESYDDFLYQHDDLGCITHDVFRVVGEVSEDLYVGIHAGVHRDAQINMNALTTFRGRVTERIAHPGGDSYFNTTVSGDITGTFDGFSIDTSRGISTEPTYNATIWSSYDPNFPDGLIRYKENLDLVNYIINQDYTAHGYTYGDVQRAIWTVIGPKVSTSGLGSWSQGRADRIIEKAETNGEGFMPDCDGRMVAMVLQPVRRDGVIRTQVTIINVPMEDIGFCTKASTPDDGAWAVPGENPITQMADLTCE